jgi:hypothetical protein
MFSCRVLEASVDTNLYAASHPQQRANSDERPPQTIGWHYRANLPGPIFGRIENSGVIGLPNPNDNETNDCYGRDTGDGHGKGIPVGLIHLSPPDRLFLNIIG